ncbi:MAG: DUF4347 domain-containing protein, partial [Planctomycetia bacterium]
MLTPFGPRQRLADIGALRRASIRRRRGSRPPSGLELEPLEGRRLFAADATRPFVPAAAPMHGVVFIDSSLVASIPRGELAGSLVVAIDDSRDAINQITTALSGLAGIDTVRLISHGSDGTLWFGSQAIDSATLAA